MSKRLEPEGVSLPEAAERMHVMPKTSADRILWSFMGGTLVWVLYFISVYGLTSLTCFWGWFALTAGSSGEGLRITQVVATVVAILLNAYFALVAYREWQRSKEDGRDEEVETLAARNPLLAFVTFLVNSLYILIILVSLVPILVLPICFR